MVRRGGDADASGEGTSWLVLRHVQAEGLGLLANVLRDRGIHHRYLDLPRGEAPPRDLTNVGGLIVLGGPMAVYEAEHTFLRTESGLVERALTAGRPVLGICLGAQLIASALGARVYAGERREVGWAPITLTPEGRDDSVFGVLEPELTVFHMHGDTYDLPLGRRRLRAPVPPRVHGDHDPEARQRGRVARLHHRRRRRSAGARAGRRDPRAPPRHRGREGVLGVLRTVRALTE
jgi:GMP synthase-like glutamine amidotransferase